jgi:AcrR family transcriptional regulator
MNQTPGPRSRRRGAELESALLEAAWDQLVAEGFGRFTIEAVAERAHTSKHVLYRRWAGREELLRAAIRHHGAATTPHIPDTGSLREDLLATLRRANTRSNDLAALFTALMASHFQDTGLTPAELRAEFLGDRVPAMKVILDRAVARGEVDPARLTPRVVAVPFDLFRHEAFMTLDHVPDRVLTEIVDEVFLPLIGAPSPSPTAPQAGPPA